MVAAGTRACRHGGHERPVAVAYREQAVPTCPWPDKAAGTARCRSGEAVDRLVDKLIWTYKCTPGEWRHKVDRLVAIKIMHVTYRFNMIVLSRAVLLHLHYLTAISYMIAWNQLLVCHT